MTKHLNDIKKAWPAQAEHLALPCALFLMEIAFKGLTVGGFVPAVAFLALCSAAVGCALELLVTLIPSTKTRHLVRTAILALLGVLFLVELFVYRAFKLYYDPVTVLSGAGDVAGQFGGTAASLVLSPAGLCSVALFLAPAIACGVAPFVSVRTATGATGVTSASDVDGTSEKSEASGSDVASALDSASDRATKPVMAEAGGISKLDGTSESDASAAGEAPDPTGSNDSAEISRLDAASDVASVSKPDEASAAAEKDSTPNASARPDDTVGNDSAQVTGLTTPPDAASVAKLDDASDTDNAAKLDEVAGAPVAAGAPMATGTVDAGEARPTSTLTGASTLDGASDATGTSNTPQPAATRTNRRTLLALGGTSVLAGVLALVLAAGLGQPLRVLTDRYSFQKSVATYGFVPSLGKEVQIAFTGGNLSFETTTDTKSSKPEKEPETEKKSSKKSKVDTSPNQLDIDFAALAKKTDGTWAELDRYVASLKPSARNKMTGLFKGKNLIFISAEAFSAEAIRKDTTPTLWKMWNEGIQLTDYYQFDTAGTTGGECANIFGLLATEGGDSVKATAEYNNHMTMGSLLDAEGYEGWAFHNNTYTYYDRDLTHNNLGYSHGYMGYGNGMEKWVTWQWPQSDLEMVKGTFRKLYGKASPFNVYYMSVSGHSDYGPGENMMAVKNWDVVEDLPYSDRVKGYLAANVEFDRAMKWLLNALKKRGIADDTVIVISADHFPYGLDDDGPLGQLPYLSELYGYDVETIFQRDHNRPIIWCGSLAKKDPIVVDTPTISIDLLPTLCNLFDVEWDSRLLPGRDVFSDKDPLVFNLDYDWKTDLGTYYASSGTFEPVEGATIPDGYVDQVSADVANRITYCHGVLTTDYYRHVFGD